MASLGPDQGLGESGSTTLVEMNDVAGVPVRFPSCGWICALCVALSTSVCIEKDASYSV